MLSVTMPVIYTGFNIDFGTGVCAVSPFFETFDNYKDSQAVLSNLTKER